MTAIQLIERLKEFPPDREVYIDTGNTCCDCVKTGTIFTGYINEKGSLFFPDRYDIDRGYCTLPIIVISL